MGNGRFSGILPRCVYSCLRKNYWVPVYNVLIGWLIPSTLCVSVLTGNDKNVEIGTIWWFAAVVYLVLSQCITLFLLVWYYISAIILQDGDARLVRLLTEDGKRICVSPKPIKCKSFTCGAVYAPYVSNNVLEDPELVWFDGSYIRLARNKAYVFEVVESRILVRWIHTGRSQRWRQNYDCTISPEENGNFVLGGNDKLRLVTREDEANVLIFDDVCFLEAGTLSEPSMMYAEEVYTVGEPMPVLADTIPFATELPASSPREDRSI